MAFHARLPLRTHPRTAIRTTVEIHKYPDGPGGVKTELYLIQGGGHPWPGRPLHLPERTIGKASQEFSATDVTWHFFKSCPGRVGTVKLEAD